MRKDWWCWSGTVWNIRKTAPSIKIQLNLSETEKKYIRLFKKRGFKEEAVLKDHYRIGEHMHIFAKVIGN